MFQFDKFLKKFFNKILICDDKWFQKAIGDKFFDVC